jgi:hypothetical protein
VCISHTSRFSLFHSIFQVIQCLYLIFHVFQVSCHSTVPTMYFSYLKFPMYFKYLKFSLFCIYCMSHSVCFSFHTFFSVFLAIFHVLLCEFLLFLVCQFSRHIPGPIVCISQYVTYSTVFCHISGPTVCVSHFPRFSVFFAIFHVLPCEFLISLVGECYLHIPGPTVGISHFSRFSVFLVIFQVIQCLCLFFPRFSVFSPKSRSYSVYFSYFNFFNLSLCIPSHTVFVSHFPRFFSFLATIQVLHCVLLIFKVFHCFLPYSMSYSVCFSFHTFFSVSRHISCYIM